MMKKIITFSILVVVVTLLVVSPVLAVPGKGAVKGEVTAVDTDSRTVEIKTKKGDTMLVVVPLNFDINTIEVGDEVLVKGGAGPEGSIEAEWIKPIGKAGGRNDNQDKPEGSKDNSAFCEEGKQEKSHPLTTKVAERFGVPESWVMEYFCDGYGMGAIMLALMTSELDGSEPGEMLEARKEGKGWGQIWIEKGLIGSEKEGHSPPGLLKKPDFARPKDKDD